MPRFSAGSLQVTIDPEDGCRVTSMAAGGVELVGLDDDTPGARRSPYHHGIFPMAPFAGRLRHGEFTFREAPHRVPADFEGHAIHGLVCDRPWKTESENVWTCAFDERWPYPGFVRQRLDLDERRLRLDLEVHAADSAWPMPVTAGWHPWLRRRLQLADGSESVGAEVCFDAESVYVLDGDGIPDGERAAPGPGPFDDCFTGLRSAPEVEWPGVGTLEIASGASHLVVYTEPRTAVCVEPQTGPPDAVNLGEAAVVVHGHPLSVWMELRWRPASAGNAESGR